MAEAGQYVLQAIAELAAGASDVIEAALREPLWKLGAALVLGAAVIALLSALPEEQRGSARAIVLIAVGLSALVALFAPIDWESLLG